MHVSLVHVDRPMSLELRICGSVDSFGEHDAGALCGEPSESVLLQRGQPSKRSARRAARQRYQRLFVAGERAVVRNLDASGWALPTARARV